MEKFNLHNVRFYEFQAQAIHCIAYNSDSKRLALSRANSNIELWDCTGKPFKQETYIGQKDGSIESLVWCGDRLFSAGLNGFIVEFDVESFTIKNQVAVTGGPTWCLALSPDRQVLAAGTEEGYVCLFDVTEEGLMYNKTLKKQKSRILSIGWHADSDHLVTGSVNYVHLVSVKTEKALQFPVAKIVAPKETIVWCVALLQDKTIVTGDSRGKTCFWDGTFGTLINGIQSHQADVFALQVTPDEQGVYVAGVDPVIVELRLVDGGGNKGRKKMWVKSRPRRIHTHDVRAIALTREGKLFSGGLDTYLAYSFYPPKTAVKFPATPPTGYTCMARSANCVLLSYEDKVELWRLGQGKEEGQNRFMALIQDRVKLAEITVKKNARLEWCSVSPEAEWVGYWAGGRFYLYKFTCPKENEVGGIERIRCFDEHLRVISNIVWINRNTFVAATRSSVLQVVSINGSKIEVESTLSLPSEKVAKKMACSDDGHWLVVLDSTNQITVFNMKEDYKSRVMPKARFPVTALAIDNQNQLFITYSNMTMSEFNVETCFCTPLGKSLLNKPSNDILKLNNCILNISFHNDHIFLHTYSSFYVINRKGSQSGEKREKKMIKLDANVESESNDSNSPVKMSANGMLSTIARSNHVFYFAHSHEGNLISIETNPIRLLDSLPPTLKVKKFGAS